MVKVLVGKSFSPSQNTYFRLERANGNSTATAAATATTAAAAMTSRLPPTPMAEPKDTTAQAAAATTAQAATFTTAAFSVRTKVRTSKPRRKNFLRATDCPSPALRRDRAHEYVAASNTPPSTTSAAHRPIKGKLPTTTG